MGRGLSIHRGPFIVLFLKKIKIEISQLSPKGREAETSEKKGAGICCKTKTPAPVNKRPRRRRRHKDRDSSSESSSSRSGSGSGSGSSEVMADEGLVSDTLTDFLRMCQRNDLNEEELEERTSLMTSAMEHILDFYKFPEQGSFRALIDFEHKLFAECPPGTTRSIDSMRQVHTDKINRLMPFFVQLSPPQTLIESTAQSPGRAFDKLEWIMDQAINRVAEHFGESTAHQQANNDEVGGEEAEEDDDEEGNGMSSKALKYNEYYRMLLREIAKEGYALYGTRVYKRVYTPIRDGHDQQFTFCYKPQEDENLRGLITGYCTQVYTKREIYNASIQTTPNTAIDHMSNCHPLKVEGVTVYKPFRHLFSGRDGILNLGGDMISYEAYHTVDPSTQTSNYFDTDIKPIVDVVNQAMQEGVGYKDAIMRLETPSIDTILSTQGIEPGDELYRLFLAICIGRMCHTMKTSANNENPNVFGDAWQIVPIVVGAGGTGKSSIVEQVLMKIFGRSNTAVLNEGTETKYLMDVFEGKMMWVAAEVGDKFPLGQQLFQQLVSNETVTMRQIYGAQRPYTLDMPGFMSSNTGLPYIDTEQSQKRRLVPFTFLKKVPLNEQSAKVGHGLGDPKEFVTLLVKANLAYKALQHQVKHEAGGRFHEYLQKKFDGNYFIRGQMKSLAGKDTLVSFLNTAIFEDESLVLDQGNKTGNRTYYISYRDLMEMGNNWAEQHHMGKITWDKTNVENTVQLLDAVWTREERLYPPAGEGAVWEEQVFIVGLAKQEHLGMNPSWTNIRRKNLIMVSFNRQWSDGSDCVNVGWMEESQGKFDKFKRLPQFTRSREDSPEYESCIRDVEAQISLENMNRDFSEEMLKSCDKVVMRSMYKEYPEGSNEGGEEDYPDEGEEEDGEEEEEEEEEEEVIVVEEENENEEEEEARMERTADDIRMDEERSVDEPEPMSSGMGEWLADDDEEEESEPEEEGQGHFFKKRKTSI